jgi:hypothetical protein
MTRSEMRERLALLPSWVLAQKAAANRQVIPRVVAATDPV